MKYVECKTKLEVFKGMEKIVPIMKRGREDVRVVEKVTLKVTLVDGV